MFGLARYPFGERFLLGEIRFDLFRIGVIVGQGRVNLSETEMPVLGRYLFRSQAHFVPGRDTHHGHSCSCNLGSSGPYRGIAVDQASDLDSTNHSSIITNACPLLPSVVR